MITLFWILYSACGALMPLGILWLLMAGEIEAAPARRARPRSSRRIWGIFVRIR